MVRPIAFAVFFLKKKNQPDRLTCLTTLHVCRGACLLLASTPLSISDFSHVRADLSRVEYCSMYCSSTNVCFNEAAPLTCNGTLCAGGECEYICKVPCSSKDNVYPCSENIIGQLLLMVFYGGILGGSTCASLFWRGDTISHSESIDRCRRVRWCFFFFFVGVL